MSSLQLPEHGQYELQFSGHFKSFRPSCTLGIYRGDVMPLELSGTLGQFLSGSQIQVCRSIYPLNLYTCPKAVQSETTMLPTHPIHPLTASSFSLFSLGWRFENGRSVSDCPTNSCTFLTSEPKFSGTSLCCPYEETSWKKSQEIHTPLPRRPLFWSWAAQNLGCSAAHFEERYRWCKTAHVVQHNWEGTSG